MCEKDTFKKFIAPTFREKGSSNNEIMHFKLKGLRGDNPNSNQIVPCINPLQTMQVCSSLL